MGKRLGRECQEDAPLARLPRAGEENMVQSWVGRGIVPSPIIMATGCHILLLLGTCWRKRSLELLLCVEIQLTLIKIHSLQWGVCVSVFSPMFSWVEKWDTGPPPAVLVALFLVFTLLGCHHFFFSKAWSKFILWHYGTGGGHQLREQHMLVIHRVERAWK